MVKLRFIWRYVKYVLLTENITSTFFPLILFIGSFGFCVFHCKKIITRQKFKYCLYGICTSITISDPMPRYCSKRLFRLLYYIESICSFHQVGGGGGGVLIVLQISPQMFNATPTFTFNRVNKIFCIGFRFNSIFEISL